MKNIITTFCAAAVFTLACSVQAAISSAASTGSAAAISGTYGGLDFSAFQNLSPTGGWILYATDSQSGDQGTLATGNLNLTVVPEPINAALGIFGGLVGALALTRSKWAGQLIAGKRRN